MRVSKLVGKHHLWKLQPFQLQALRASHRITAMLLQSDGADVAMPDSAQWMFSVTRQQPVRNGDFLIDVGAATSVCQQSLADSLGGKPSGPGTELRSATGHQFKTTGNTMICLHTKCGIAVASDFQIVPMNSGRRDLSSQLDKCATEATSSRFAALMERFSMSSQATDLSSSV